MEKIDYKKRAEELAKHLNQAKNGKETLIPKIERFPEIVSVKNLMSREFPENKWAIEKLVPQEGITILAGAPGNFKTWLMLSMALKIATGCNFLEKFACTRSGILIVDEENHLRLIQDRIKLLGFSDDMSIYFLSQSGFLIDKEGSVKRILEICEEKHIDVIFFDSLVRIHEADENTALAMSKVTKAIKGLCRAGKTVIIAHHERKEGSMKSSGQSRLRGSSEISAAIDSHLTVKKAKDEKDKLILEQPKLRYDEEIDPFEIGIIKKEDGISFTYLGNYSSQAEKEILVVESIGAILSENEEGLSIKEIVEQVQNNLQIGDKLIRKTLRNLIESGKISSQKGARNEKICRLTVPSL